MKTRIFNIIGIAAALAGSVACSDLKLGNDFLEKAPGVDVTVDTIFSSKLYAEQALIGAYATLRTGLTEHNNVAVECIGSFEFQNPGNKLGWDNLDSMTDIIHSYCTWGGTYKLYYNGTYNAGWENAGADDPNGLTKFGYNPKDDATWFGIRRAQLFIDNVDRVPDMSPALKAQRKAEAHLLIACQMHELLRHLGGVPILHSAVNAKNPEADFHRRTIREVADYICAQCDSAAKLDADGQPVLPWYLNDSDVSGQENGRFTRAAALALKCRVLDFIAAPLFNSDIPYWTEGPGACKDPRATNANAEKIIVPEELEAQGVSKEEYVRRMMWLGKYDRQCWQDVADACEEFFAANDAQDVKYHLNHVPGDPRASFSEGYGDRKSPEILIHSSRSHEKYGNTYHIHYFGPSLRIQNGVQNNGVGYGGGCVTLEYVDKFTTIDGQPARYADWLKSHPSKKGTETNHPFLNRDPRLYESVMTQWDKYQTRTAQMYIGGIEHMAGANATRAATGFNIRKFLWDYNDQTLFSKPCNYPYLRLSEIYLIYAEALNELGRADEAMAVLDSTRHRAGLPSMTWALLNKVQEGRYIPEYSEPLEGNPLLREEILDERARELAFEEVRWFDIIRWKRDEIFTNSLHGITQTISEGYTDGSGNKIATEINFSEPWTVEDGPIPNDRYWRKTFSSDQGRKWYFSAFPTDEVNKGYGLVQNPGWDVN